MTKRGHTKLVREGQYAAEIDIELIDAQKLDDVRETLRRGDIKTTGKLARVFKLTPIEL